MNQPPQQQYPPQQQPPQQYNQPPQQYNQPPQQYNQPPQQQQYNQPPQQYNQPPQQFNQPPQQYYNQPPQQPQYNQPPYQQPQTNTVIVVEKGRRGHGVMGLGHRQAKKKLVLTHIVRNQCRGVVGCPRCHGTGWKPLKNKPCKRCWRAFN